jgi:hypothetical protein
MRIQTIRTKDGSISYHGILIKWFTHDEFLFVPQGVSPSQPWWCKTDFWDYIESDILIGKIHAENKQFKN